MMPLRNRQCLLPSRIRSQFLVGPQLQGPCHPRQLQDPVPGRSQLAHRLWLLLPDCLADQKFRSLHTLHMISLGRSRLLHTLATIETLEIQGILEMHEAQGIQEIFVILGTLGTRDLSELLTIRVRLEDETSQQLTAERPKAYRGNPQDLKEIGRHTDRNLRDEMSRIYPTVRLVVPETALNHLAVSTGCLTPPERHATTRLPRSPCRLPHNQSPRVRQ